MNYDVVIIGGGPSGSTAGSFLRKYGPELNVAIFEREVFPRDHIGESQLPGTCAILHEMGAWDKVERAGFPIKVGATYRWGRTAELWDFEFFPRQNFRDEPRPAKYEGQRRATAFQVDRSIYDEILLDHAAETGCQIFEGTRVLEILRDGDRVTGLKLENGDIVTGRYYLDASGHSGVLRRAMGVQVENPSSLQNIALWDYWQNADWAVEIGVGGTLIQVLSLGYGWLWFIPLGPTRTSVGLVIPAEYYKKSGKRPEQLYAEALAEDERIRSLMRNATSEGLFQTTRDWSFIAARHFGENWFLIGEAGGFADPILSAGMTISHAAGREVAFTILELERGTKDAKWLKDQFEVRQSSRIRNHIRFADYWYVANEQFADLKEYTKEIAKDVGLELTPEKAWQWLAQGGFISEDLSIGTGTFTLNALKALGDYLHEVEIESPFSKYNVFRLDLSGATWSDRARYLEGQVLDTPSYLRGDRILPVDGVFDLLLNILQRESQLPRIVDRLKQVGERFGDDFQARSNMLVTAISGLEALALDGWVKPSYDPSLPIMELKSGYFAIHWNQDPPITTSS